METFTHKSIFTTEQTKTPPKESAQHGFPDKGKMATGPGLGLHHIQKK